MRAERWQCRRILVGVWLLSFVLPVALPLARAADVACSTLITSAREADQAWVQLLASDGLKLLPAKVRPLPAGLLLEPEQELSAEVSGLVSGVIVTADGALLSSAWHRCGQAPVAILAQISQAQAEVAALEEQRVKTNLQLRISAGLGEVDAIYERAHALAAQAERLDADLAQLRRIQAQRAADNAHSKESALTTKDS
jgi:hypothetical protein